MTITIKPGEQIKMWKSINDWRRAHHLGLVDLDSLLTTYAENHAKAMAKARKLWHTDLNDVPGVWSRLGETVGTGGSTDGIQWAFINSPHHKPILLDRHYTQVGVGVQHAQSAFWVSYVFGA